MKTMKITLPVAADALGRWLEQNGANISISCSLGKYDVYISRKKLLSYSYAAGEHAEHWVIGRHGPDLMTTLEDCLRAAGALEDMSQRLRPT